MKDRYYIKVKGHKNVFQRNGIGMQADVIILISSKRDFKLKVTRRNTDDQFILIKGTVTKDIQSKPKYIYNTPSSGAPSFIKVQ